MVLHGCGVSHPLLKKQVAVGQNQWYRFRVPAPPILEPFLVGIGMFTGGTGF